MNKERTKVGDIRINSATKKPETCIEVFYHADGWVGLEWEDYEEHLLHTRLGMFPGVDQVHTLQYFVDALNDHLSEHKDTIKIRYAYIASSKNIPVYPETLKFKVFSLEQLETQLGNNTIQELIADNTSLITIKGRDLCTGRVDEDGKDIYEGDRIRWFSDSGSFIDEIIDRTSHFSELDTTRDCKVIGTIYDGDTI